MGTRLDGPLNRSLTPNDMATIRMVHDAYVVAVDNLRDQTQAELADALGVSVERVRNVWWWTGCT